MPVSKWAQLGSEKEMRKLRRLFDGWAAIEFVLIPAVRVAAKARGNLLLPKARLKVDLELSALKR